MGTQRSTGLGAACFYRIWSVRNAIYSLIARKASDTIHSFPYGIGGGATPRTSMIRVVPNPAVNSATLHFTLAEPGKVIFNLYNQTAEGKLVVVVRTNNCL